MYAYRNHSSANSIGGPQCWGNICKAKHGGYATYISSECVPDCNKYTCSQKYGECVNGACMSLCKEIKCSQKYWHCVKGRCVPKCDKYDCIKNHSRCIDGKCVPDCKESENSKIYGTCIKETLLETNAVLLEENVSQVYVYLSTNQTLTAFKFFHYLALLST